MVRGRRKGRGLCRLVFRLIGRPGAGAEQVAGHERSRRSAGVLFFLAGGRAEPHHEEAADREGTGAESRTGPDQGGRGEEDAKPAGLLLLQPGRGEGTPGSRAELMRASSAAVRGLFRRGRHRSTPGGPNRPSAAAAPEGARFVGDGVGGSRWETGLDWRLPPCPPALLFFSPHAGLSAEALRPPALLLAGPEDARTRRRGRAGAPPTWRARGAEGAVAGRLSSPPHALSPAGSAHGPRPQAPHLQHLQARRSPVRLPGPQPGRSSGQPLLPPLRGQPAWRGSWATFLGTGFKSGSCSGKAVWQDQVEGFTQALPSHLAVAGKAIKAQAAAAGTQSQASVRHSASSVPHPARSRRCTTSSAASSSWATFSCTPKNRTGPLPVALPSETPGSTWASLWTARWSGNPSILRRSPRMSTPLCPSGGCPAPQNSGPRSAW